MRSGEVDVLGLSLACTKHSFLVQSLAELPRIMAEAFEVANAGRLARFWWISRKISS